MESGWTLGYAESRRRPGPHGADRCSPSARRAGGTGVHRQGHDWHQARSTGLKSALAACRPGDTLVVTKLDRLARSLRDATDIAEELTRRGVKLNLGGSIYDPTDPVGDCCSTCLGWSRSSSPISSGPAPGKAWPQRRSAGSSRGGGPSFPPRRSGTSWRFTAQGITQSRSSSNYSESDARRVPGARPNPGRRRSRPHAPALTSRSFPTACAVLLTVLRPNCFLHDAADRALAAVHAAVNEVLNVESKSCAERHGNFASRTATPRSRRWLRRALERRAQGSAPRPAGDSRRGRPSRQRRLRPSTSPQIPRSLRLLVAHRIT